MGLGSFQAPHQTRSLFPGRSSFAPRPSDFLASIFRLALDFPSPRLCNCQPLAKVRRFGPRGYLFCVSA
ncbi:hypothetical protein XPR_0085 [Xanthomonas arboricola pv. pruni MAFF 301420]|uniref:Uncharacterized protein n=2 Tax=Xanthomonas arboricola pv. pruni TaxID=69929 RepID=W4RXD9_9XANT|nr:hypothetical protein [Xanthomonas campestris]BBJ98665.1 hypothetical protein Xcc1_43950 [Xanthomonas campestris pv. campestris]GAE49037.1 hypothetical protein XPU_0569 [Xanthomonas arboricola pv. pruni str. MAFF 311562]GAE53450.1 hypothetical protein XPR_0085 [Xanthomonas arboricola pv. pruni MAFF 301420]GAE59191.1 hypothetical protein XPN_1097 [Xanthomonas arboricola pv. pruni MAFF 301427]GAE49050.1 hypothetical protein XPU_0582 [Xanthomonas arboricola pv. pruni str. MAFF 311562]